MEELRRERAAKVPKDQSYLSISDAIALYDVCRDTLYRLVRSKALRSYNLRPLQNSSFNFPISNIFRTFMV